MSRNSTPLNWYDQLLQPGIKTVSVSKQSGYDKKDTKNGRTESLVTVPTKSRNLQGIIRKDNRTPSLRPVSYSRTRSDIKSRQVDEEMREQLIQLERSATFEADRKAFAGLNRHKGRQTSSAKQSCCPSLLQVRQASQPSIAPSRILDGNHIAVQPLAVPCRSAKYTYSNPDSRLTSDTVYSEAIRCTAVQPKYVHISRAARLYNAPSDCPHGRELYSTDEDYALHPSPVATLR